MLQPGSKSLDFSSARSQPDPQTILWGERQTLQNAGILFNTEVVSWWEERDAFCLALAPFFQMIHSFHGSIGGTINFRKNYSNDDGFNECLWDGESSQHVKLHELNELWIALISWAMSWECFWRWLHLAKCCSERCLRSWMPWQRKHTIGNHVGKTVS